MALKGTQLFVPRSVLPEPEDDEFYFTDLVGLDVKSTDGKRVGTIKDIHDFGAGVMLEIQPVKSAEKQASFFHPFTKVAVPKIERRTERRLFSANISYIYREGFTGFPAACLLV